jgi:hypothetical protein
LRVNSKLGLLSGVTVLVLVLSACGSSSQKAKPATTTKATTSATRGVSISKGAAYSGAECTSSSCAYIHVETSNGAGGRYTCTVEPGSPPAAGIGDFTNSSGAVIYGNVGADSSNEYFFLGYPGAIIHCTVNGVQSNSMTWY